MATSTIKGMTFSKASADSTATTIGAGANAWITVPLPSSGKAIALMGYYLSGGTTCNVYNARLITNGAQFALRNYGTQSATVTVTADYLVI